MNPELLSHSTEAHDCKLAELKVRIGELADSIAKLVEVSNRGADNIRTVARIAEAHESRLTNLKG